MTIRFSKCDTEIVRTNSEGLVKYVLLGVVPLS